MNDREDWHVRSPFMEQFACPSPEIMPPFGPSSSWVQVPPQTMPWGLPPHAHPAVVRFTAGDFSHHPIKRKPEPAIDLPPAKQLVTEEKMAAHMRNLHISDVDSPVMSCEEDSMESERLPKLVVCDEVRKLKTDPVIPQALLSRLEKPKMALVLWRPPAGDLGSKLKEITRKNEEEEKEGDIAMDSDNNFDNTFRPIDPVPQANQTNQYLQPTPHFYGGFPFS